MNSRYGCEYSLQFNMIMITTNDYKYLSLLIQFLKVILEVELNQLLTCLNIVLVFKCVINNVYSGDEG